MAPRGRRHQLFAFDFMVSSTLEVFLLEANGKPALCSRNDPGGRRCRETPCAGWLVNQTRQMERDRLTLVWRATNRPAHQCADAVVVLMRWLC
jgi:hypothetical protein